MKKVWIINHYADPPGVGKFTRHYHFAKNLIKLGYDVKIFTASTIHTTDINFIKDHDSYKEMKIEGVNFIFVRCSDYYGNSGKRVKNMMDYAFRVVNVTRKFGEPDIVFCSAPHSLTWLAGYRIAKRSKAKFVVETRDLWPETFVSAGKMKRNSITAKILYQIEKFIYKKADKLIFTMPGGPDYLREKGYDASKAISIPHGIDLEEYQDNQENKRMEDPDLANDKFNVLYTGALGLINNIPGLMNTMRLLKEYEDIQLIIYGAGYEEEFMKNYIREHELTNVKFKGKVGKEMIPGILSQSQLNVIPGVHIDLYRKYGFSLNKTPEYLAAGKPILSSLICKYDILEKYQAGMTVKDDTDEAFAEGILYFYELYKNHPEEYQKYCENAKKASYDMDHEALTKKLVELFK